MRARAQAKREQVRRAERVRRMRLWTAGGAVGAVVVVVVILLIVNSMGGAGAAQSELITRNPTVQAQLAAVPASSFDAVAPTTSQAIFKALGSGRTKLVASGKPEVVYVGAEYCPFCAAERWPLVTALDRFGSFADLGTISSSSTDTYPNTPTLALLGATYTSEYLTFSSTEFEDRAGHDLQPFTGVPLTVYSTYDKAPYLAPGIPFLDMANLYVSSGAQYLPTLLAGLSSAQVAATISNSTSTIGSAVLGSANVISAGICAIDGDQPTAVCTSPGVMAGKAVLADGSASSGSSSSGSS